MTFRILIDMNLSPGWIGEFERHGWSAIHWSGIGDPRAPDHEIMGWARANGCVIFTHDLDFGTLLALTHGGGPSVIQLRGEEVLPQQMGACVIAALRQHQADLLAGALLVIEATRSRVRILPF